MKKYDDLALEIKTAFNGRFYDRQKKSNNSQTANAMALQFGLVPGGEEADVVQNLVADIIEIHDGHFSTGHLGGRYLYEVLSDCDYGDVSRLILDQQTYPGMGYLLTKRGATTFWESWGEKEIDENSAGVRSRNHPFQAGCDAWFFKGVGGIRPDPGSPGFKNIILKPDLTCGLCQAATAFNSMYGLIKSEWQNIDGQLIWSVSVPVNTTARLFFPTTKTADVYESDRPVLKSDEFEFVESGKNRIVYRIGSGDYEFKINRNGRNRIFPAFSVPTVLPDRCFSLR
jgi:alpha-L-rhamnosidase